MLNITLRENKINDWILNQTKEIIKSVRLKKWTWGGHLAKRNDNRWTLRLTWRHWLGKRNDGRQCVRWIVDMKRFVGTANWYQRHKIEFGGQEMLRHIGDRGRNVLDNSITVTGNNE